MGMNRSYGTEQTQQEVTKLIRHAVEQGVTFFDTADMYGPHVNEILVGKAEADDISRYLEKNKIAAKSYHSGRPSSERTRVYQLFCSNKLRVLPSNGLVSPVHTSVGERRAIFGAGELVAGKEELAAATGGKTISLC